MATIMQRSLYESAGRIVSTTAGVVLGGVLSMPGPAFPQEAAAPLILTPVLELPEPPPPDDFVILLGRPADPARYPVSFRLAVSPSEVCTWFLVAARVLVTAAHCVRRSTAITIKTRSAPGSTPPELSYNGNCQAAPRYPADKSMDWALCLLDLSFPLPNDPRIKAVGYEKLNTHADQLARGQSIEITGFGCRSTGGIVSDVYMVGTAAVAKLPPGVDTLGVTDPTPNYIEIQGDPSILCAGDSGGPAFLVNQAESSGNLRTVIGINSRTVNRDGLSVGYLASASTEDVLAWIRRWAKDNGQRICGVHADARGCRPSG